MPRPSAQVPSREAILEFVRSSTGPVGRREIAKAFDVRGAERAELRRVLKEMADEGLLDFGRRRKVAPPGALPEVAVVEITGTDENGEPLAQPANWRGDGPAPRILVLEDRGSGAMGPGDRALVRLERRDENRYVARVIRRLTATAPRVLGIYEAAADGAGRVRPTDKKARSEITVDRRDAADAKPGDLVSVELLPRSRNRLGLPAGRVVERFAGIADPRSFSRIAIQEHDIPDVFPREAEDQAERARPVTLGKREDLRDIPLVTIDGEDARDFDDAVFATADDDPGNPGGFRLLVAIADVAHYVRPGDALDREALKRGNSVYFPDRVVPMLPEALSNGLCSLRPDGDRACMAVEITIDAEGGKRSHCFTRGLMRSRARLTYRQVQQAVDGGDAAGVPEGVLAPLYGAYRALKLERGRRGALELEIPEKRVILDDDGKVVEIGIRDRLDSHMLIEEFMILANVCAAETLEARRQPCMYRIHEDPDPEKVNALADVLESLGISLAKGQVVRPKTFNGVLAKVKGQPAERMVNEMILRAQSQAQYSPSNAGHFGLGLARYAHFTSPIRRYSDLLVHRALIRGLHLGDGALGPADDDSFMEWGEHISATERRAAAAERQTVDRYLARHLADRVGGQFDGRINGVTRFGLFVTLSETGADGLVPIRSLPDDYYDHDEARHSLTGRFHGRVYRLGDPVEVRLIDADPVSGALALEILSGGTQETPGGSGRVRRRGAAPKRPGGGRGGNRGGRRR
ncbi:ribonuclease R [Thalassobaculum sp.]|uniref:ribonuclease R n=1 Tax=Thalassobaculum sp. TaxID=2022740 RepID=UPI0032ED831E